MSFDDPRTSTSSAVVPGGEEEDPENYPWHLAKATLLAAIATSLLVWQQTRHSFYLARTAFVEHHRRRSNRRESVAALAPAAAAAASTTAKRRSNNSNPKKAKKKTTSSSSTMADDDGGVVVDDDDDGGAFVVGFFHPRCSSGGGGERVLWKSIQALGELREGKFPVTKRRPQRGARSSTTSPPPPPSSYSKDVRANVKNLCVVVYTIDEPSDDYDRKIVEDVRARFNIVVPTSLPVHFVHLHELRHLLDEPKRLTLILESFSTARLAYHALNTVNPHVYVDTTGCAFTFLVAKLLAGCRIGAYVHYPTISVDMLSLVRDRRPSYNNRPDVASNTLASMLKLVYYAAFAVCYGLAGGLADMTMVNSRWTKDHVERLWRFSRGGAKVVFPPVDTRSVRDLPTSGRERMVISIGQFRPEKDHALQLRSFAKLLEMRNGAMREAGVTLVMIGSCRGADDARRVDELRVLAGELGVGDRVEFVLNEPYSVVRDYLRRASVGVHTMWNEHFGIGVVEMMAAGLVTIAHDSGGPKSDIILRPWRFDDDDDDYSSTTLPSGGGDVPTGCLASTAEEYAATMYEIFKRDGSSSDNVVLRGVREAGRKSAERFSDEEFLDSFKEAVLSSSLFETGGGIPLYRLAIYIVVVIAVLVRYF